MAHELTPDEALQAYRERYERCVNDRTTPNAEFVVDVDDLTGASGERLGIDDAMRVKHGAGWSHYHDRELDTEQATATLSGLSEQFMDEMTYDYNEPEQLAFMTRDVLSRVIGHVADRYVDASVEPLYRAVDDLREPVRTVAVHCLCYGLPAEDVARGLGTSIETIEFLTGIALDQLAAHVRIEVR